MPPKVFVNYRSEDSGQTASRLARDLERRFGRAAVFLDHEHLGGGDAWPERLRTEVRLAAVVLVLIGHRWLTVHDPDTGDRRLNLPEDWVRQEIEEALLAGRSLVPVLVDGARPLNQASLRTLPSITRLASLQALALRRADWDGDVQRIEQRLIELGLVPLPPPQPETSARAATTPPPVAPPAPTRPPEAALRRNPRASVAALLAGTLGLVGLGLWWQNQRDADPAPAQPRPVLAAQPVAASAPPPPLPASATAVPAARTVDLSVEGMVEVRALFAADFERLHDSFTIEARTLADGRSLGEASVRRDRRFAIPVRTVAGALPDVRLAWKRAAADPFVLWPVSPPQTQPPFQAFRFNQLDNVYVQERKAILSDVRAGNFSAAHAQLQDLQRLLDLYDDPRQLVVDKLTMGTLRYKLLQDICAAASQHRSQVGRSKVTDDMIGFEREWRKAQLAAAQDGGQGPRSVALALNGWAGFARQVYSLGQRAWADRPVGSRPEALATPQSQSWLLEDLGVVASGLEWLRDLPDRFAPRDRLDTGRRELMDQVIAGDAADVSMSRLSDLLHRLQRP